MYSIWCRAWFGLVVACGLGTVIAQGGEEGGATETGSIRLPELPSSTDTISDKVR